MSHGIASSDPGAGQRLHIALLFSDVCNYTALTEAIDPEDTDEIKQALESEAKRVIGLHGGVVNQLYGDGILAVFGYPTPGENDIRRALEAALDLHAAIASLRLDSALPPGFALRLHSGVHAGVVFVRQGSRLHGQYEVTGDAVNTAQRLCSVAARDEILVSRTALSGLEPFFEIDEVPPLTLKGKEKPLLACVVRKRSDVDTRLEALHRRSLTPFVGRAPELGRLDAVFAEARQGRCRVVQVTGRAGMGKTRLLSVFRDRLPGDVAAYAGSCEQFGNVAPLRPFAQILRQVCRVEAGLAPPQAVARVTSALDELDGSLREHLAALLPLLSLRPWSGPRSVDVGGRPAGVVSVLAALFAAIAARQPLVLVLDDWQWADDASNQALHAIVREERDRAVMVVVGTRTADRDAVALGDASELPLQPFTFAESTDAVRSLLPRALDLGLSVAIHRRSGGSPLFVEEVCQSLSGEAPPEMVEARIPTTLHGLIQSRVAQLPADAAEVLRAAAVMGNKFPRWLVDKSTDGSEVDRHLALLAEHDFCHPVDDSGFQFKHGITREVVYESVPIRQRRHLHRVIAQALEERSAGNPAELYEELAYHYAGAAEHSRAVDYAELAGDKALATSALDRARSQYRAALTELERASPGAIDKKRWLQICAKWAAPCVYSPAREQLETLEKATEYARELQVQDPLAHAEYWLGWIHYALGEQGDAVNHLQAALDIARRIGNSKLVAQLLTTLGQSHAAMGSYETALSLLDEGIALKRAQAEGPATGVVPVGFVYALGCRALVYGDRGDFARAHQDMEEALAITQGVGHAIEGSLLGLLAMIQLCQGEWAACLETVRRARATAEQVNGPYVLAMSNVFGAYARWALDRRPESLSEMRKNVEWLEARDIGLFLSFNQGHLAEALAAEQQHDSARAFAHRALRRAQQKDAIGETAAHRALARSSLSLEEDRAKVLGHLQDAMDSAERRASCREIALTRLLRGEAKRAWGELEEAGADLRAAAAAFDEMGMTSYSQRARDPL